MFPRYWFHIFLTYKSLEQFERRIRRSKYSIEQKQNDQSSFVDFILLKKEFSTRSSTYFQNIHKKIYRIKFTFLEMTSDGEDNNMDLDLGGCDGEEEYFDGDVNGMYVSLVYLILFIF